MMTWLVNAKVKHLEWLLSSYRKQHAEELFIIRCLGFFQFKDKKFHKEQDFYYRGLVDGVKIAIKVLNDKTIR